MGEVISPGDLGSGGQLPAAVFHATRHSNLALIQAQGLLRRHHGAVHGSMDYGPPGGAVYVSTSEVSGNLNTHLFDGCDDDDFVVVLMLDASFLDKAKIFPDDAFFYMLDEDFNLEDSCDLDGLGNAARERAIKGFVKENAVEFADQFGLGPDKAARLLDAFVRSDGSMPAYARIAGEMGPEYLAACSEAAYLGDISSQALQGWSAHPAHAERARCVQRSVCPRPG